MFLIVCFIRYIWIDMHYALCRGISKIILVVYRICKFGIFCLNFKLKICLFMMLWPELYARVYSLNDKFSISPICLPKKHGNNLIISTTKKDKSCPHERCNVAIRSEGLKVKNHKTSP